MKFIKKYIANDNYYFYNFVLIKNKVYTSRQIKEFELTDNDIKEYFTIIELSTVKRVGE